VIWLVRRKRFLRNLRGLMVLLNRLTKLVRPLLQSLDIAKAGEDFVSEWVERERETIRILESSQ
jgi:hypothetical protein